MFDFITHFWIAARRRMMRPARNDSMAELVRELRGRHNHDKQTPPNGVVFS